MEHIDIEDIITIAEKAGEIILSYYQTDAAKIQKKQDNSPVTTADIKSSEFICQELNKLYPQTPIVSEEAIPDNFHQQTYDESYWVIDPLDGTRGFIDHNDEFSVNIALIQNYEPILGVIYIPVTKVIYHASNDKKQSFKRLPGGKDRVLKQRKVQGQELNLAINRSFKLPTTKDGDFDFTPIRLNAAGKFGLVAEGTADVYFRDSPTCEWDTAAGHCIVNNMGGCLLDWSGKPLMYGKNNFLNPPFICLGDSSLSFKHILDELT